MIDRLAAGCRTVASAILLVALVSGGGCEKDDGGSAIVADAAPSAALAIVSPQSGAVVQGEALTIIGVGMRDAAAVNVRVHTDRWYTQVGTVRVSSNNSWSYSPVYVSGRGAFNNHTIEVAVTHSDGSRERAAVSGVVRE